VYEGIFLVVLLVVVILAIRPASKYNNPVVIHKPGLYHATLAPGLEWLKNLIEQLAGQFSAESDISTRYFEVRAAEGCGLLAVGYRSGLLYCQCLPSLSHEVDSQTLRKFSEQVMADTPMSVSQDAQAGEQLCDAVARAVNQLQMTCQQLQS